MEAINMEELANQLRCPSGENGKETGENMFRSNSNMIFKTVDSLELQASDTILEIGFGNGKHLSYVLEKTGLLQYTGADISEVMVEEAKTNNAGTTAKGITQFVNVPENGTLPFEANSFNKCFTVNTLYFWTNPEVNFKEIFRVLKPGGQLSLAFIEAEFGRMLPFTQYGFNFKQAEEVAQYLKNAGFNLITLAPHTETTMSNAGQEVVRPFVIATAVKVE